MKKMIGINVLIFFVGLLSHSCMSSSTAPINYVKKEFSSSFESVDDFADFYKTPQRHLGTSFHGLSDSIVHSGTYSHKAWIDGITPPSTIHTNNNHRGYPTLQFQKTPEGAFQTPCYITFWVWLDMELNTNPVGEDDWFSFATFTDDDSDNWKRTVLVNLSADGFVHLQHTIKQGERSSIFQNTELSFPQKEWVELKIYLDFRENGYAKVWQNNELVSHSQLDNITNKIAQAHFGLYCAPQLASGVVFNDDLIIKEVDEE